MAAIFLREANEGDAELLFAWANDIDVRRNAFSQHEITWEEHTRWLKRKLNDESCRIYIAQEGSEPVGQIRLDIEDGRAEIDYSVAAARRGRGFGKEMLQQAAQIPNPDIRVFYARVKTGNDASAAAFAACGFQRTAEHSGYAEYEKPYDRQSAEREHIVICTQKSWNVANAEKLKNLYRNKYDITVITEKEKLTPAVLSQYEPKFIFIPHWSYIIPEEVFSRWTCVVFHMTDLPFGRGGSPLQNLIVRGFTHTKISAIRVDKGLDTGDIYGKEDLELSGTADEILRRASEIIFTKMIPYLLEHDPQPTPQSGEAVTFRRRKPEDGRLLAEMDEKTIYDYIRMLDGEGYPNAFVELGDYVLRFREAAYEGGSVTAKVTFEKK
ncbi:MAG: GNAT family N-acetyltransferase [Lachnospiraceae bacterium]|nr:GNAT family N-acetyltransferase [Lachnospiraceae bacterium]